MKDNQLVVSISSMKDIENITNKTKYINLDISNNDYDVISYFVNYGENYLYSEIIEGTKGYIYVDYTDFVKAENLIADIYSKMPSNLNILELAKYLYIEISKNVFLDINLSDELNENCNLELLSKVNNLWGSLSLRRVNNLSIAKIYYYLAKRMDIDISIVKDETKNEILNKLKINKEILITNIYKDLPYIQASMKTKYFYTYNDDLELDKKIKYCKTKYTDYYLDKALKNIDYLKEDCVQNILYKTENILNIENLKPYELSIIYKYIFNTYCPNYNIKINNLFLNNKNKFHFIMISYNDYHYSYNYKKKSFVKVNDLDILNNLKLGKISIYKDELIPNIKLNMNL